MAKRWPYARLVTASFHHTVADDDLILIRAAGRTEPFDLHVQFLMRGEN